jgi:NADH-ubiquinone oxidoreductase chain 6
MNTINSLNIVLEIITIISVIAALATITSTNPIIAIIFLITLFLNIAVYLILSGLNFIGLSYLLVYIGAITVLVLFIVMMIAPDLSNTVETGTNYSKLLPSAAIIACLALSLFSIVVPSFVVDLSHFELYDLIIKSFSNVINSILGMNSFSNSTLIGFINNNNIYDLSNLPSYLDLWIPTDELLSLTTKYNSLPSGLANSIGESIIQNTTPSSLLYNNLQIQSVGSSIYGSYSIILILSSFLLLIALVTPIILTRNNQESRS